MHHVDVAELSDKHYLLGLFESGENSTVEP